MIFYHATCIHFIGLLLQGVNGIRRQYNVFYFTSRLTRGGYLLVNYISEVDFLSGDPT